MAVSPQGISIQAAYRWFREGRLIVNRQYQRKLVWTVAEKERLIDSILKDYPLPLFLLAEKPSENPEAAEDDSIYEVIDGMQRLNAIFSFIENGFLYDGRCFDVSEFARARQLAEQKVFSTFPNDVPRLDAKACANLLDYQLAMTIFPGEIDARITDVFGRINSSGKQLSDQERRQAGVLSPFADLVRELSAEIRGDVSRERLLLSEMPEISIETPKNPHGYGLKAEEIFWCRQGVLRTNHLRDSDDEEIVADICATILFDEPVEASGDFKDRLYTEGSEEYKNVNLRLAAYGRDKLSAEIKKVFSVVREAIEASSEARFHFRDTVYPKPTSNPQKQAFYATFMAFFDLIMREGQLPSSPADIMAALNNMSDRINVGQKHIKTEDRRQNIRVVKGLIADFFAKTDVPILGHGPGLVFDFENSIRRSRTETSRYEFKQGILRLDENRAVDDELLNRMVETMSGIANCGPEGDGFLYLGIADKEKDAERVRALDGVEPLSFEHVQIVGVEREAAALDLSMDRYLRIIEDKIANSILSEPLKTQLRTGIDLINYKGRSVVRIRVPRQTDASFLGDDCFFRAGSSTIRASGPQIAAISKQFRG